MTKEEYIKYWIESSDNDYITMENLYNSKDYSWSLFIGHIVIEKLLKAYYYKVNSNHVPFVHNLLFLAENSKMILTEEQQRNLAAITRFNINARYDDYKKKFFILCTREYTEKWINTIKEYRKWIKQLLTA